MDGIKEYIPSSLQSVEVKWAHIVASYPPERVEFVGTFLVQFFSFWMLSLLFLLLDNVSALQKFKIQPLPKQPSLRALWQCLRCTLGNQAITTTLHFLQLLVIRRFTPLQSVYRVEASTPSLNEFVTNIACCLIVRETIFYYGHRLLHHPLVYARFHKQHHRFTTPIALASQYAHPVEHITSNIIPIAGPGRLFGVHILVFWVFMTQTIVQATVAHSGYDTCSLLGWKPGVHDAHHEFFNVNYGLLGIMDWLHGTRYVQKKKDD